MGTPCRLLAYGLTPLMRHASDTALVLMVKSLASAIKQGGLDASDIDALIALPSLISDHQFMQAHLVATEAGMLPKRNFIARTLDVGGAGPVAALLEACLMIQHEGRHAVAVVAADCAGSAPTEEFLKRADAACLTPRPPAHHKSPVIPNEYDRVAQWQMQRYGVTRQQLAMCASLMTLQASRHPHALVCRPATVEEVLRSPQVAPATTRMECARRADGGAALIVASPEFLRRKGLPADSGVVVLGGGERSGAFSLPETITEECFSAAEAAAASYQATNTSTGAIDYFSLYDCFPICLLRALEAVGLAAPGQGGQYVQGVYDRLFSPAHTTGEARADGGLCDDQTAVGSQGKNSGRAPADARSGAGAGRVEGCSNEQCAGGEVWPVNTHGGLLGFGAPWEVPAMYGIIEAWVQLKGVAEGRQVQGARRALVYGNGGIFGASAVAVLARPGVQEADGGKGYGSRADCLHTPASKL